jgi:hypothetical protein
MLSGRRRRAFHRLVSLTAVLIGEVMVMGGR